MRPLLAGAAVALMCALSPTAAAAASLAPPAATPPPDLVTFEQQAEALHVNSVKFSVLYELSLGSFPGLKGMSFTLPIEGEGVMSTSPAEGSLKAGIFGQDTEVRLVGDTSYIRKPTIAEMDKGRPWVREDHKRSTAGVDPIGLGGNVVGATTSGEAGEAPAGGSFAGLIDALSGASAITEVGPEIVNGSEATEFAATLSPQRLLAGISNELLEKAHKLGKLTASLYVFFAPNGLPVRTSWTFGAGKLRITSSVDILETEVPVSVQAPPADKTISAKRLKQLEAAKQREERSEHRRLNACIKQESSRPEGHPRKHSPGALRKCFERAHRTSQLLGKQQQRRAAKHGPA